MSDTRGPDAPPKLTWEEIKALQPTGPVPVNPEEPSTKIRRTACGHARKHHTAAGGCRKCDRR